METAVAACNARLDEYFQLRTPDADTDRVLASLVNVQRTIQAIPRDLKTEFDNVAATLFAPILEHAANLGVKAAQAHTAAFVTQTTTQVEALMNRTFGAFSGQIHQLSSNLQDLSTTLITNLGNVSTAVAQIDTTLQGTASVVTNLGDDLKGAATSMNQIRKDSANTAKRVSDCVKLMGTHLDTEHAQQLVMADVVKRLADVSATVVAGISSANTLGPHIQHLTTTAASMAAAMDSTVGALKHYAATADVAQQQYVAANSHGQELLENIAHLGAGTHAMLQQIHDATTRLGETCVAIRALSEERNLN